MRTYFSDVIEKNRARCKNRRLFVIRSLIYKYLFKFSVMNEFFIAKHRINNDILPISFQVHFKRKYTYEIIIG